MQKLLIFFIVQAVQKVVSLAKLYEFFFADVKLFPHAAKLVKFCICGCKTDDALKTDVRIEVAYAYFKLAQKLFAQFCV